MKSIDYKEFYDLLVPRMFEVASYQTMMCGKVDNLGKNAQNNVTQTEIHSALTYLDQFTQDYLLVPIYQQWPDLVPLVEEDTGLKRNKLKNKSDYALILDPIDGTDFYLKGEQDYSMMLGLMHKGKMELALICYPENGLIFASIKGQGAWIHNKYGSISALPDIAAVEQDYASVSCHYRFTKEPYKTLSSKLNRAGYTLTTNGDGFGTNATGILRIAKGESCAFIGPHMALHDFSIPAFVIQELGGVVKLYDYNGSNDLHSWSNVLVDYGRPDPDGPNPRYRVIVAESEKTISKVVAKITS
jgi:fructose-1,6-bisphosphatase/inositol monophosphatase family enzyme